MTVDDEDRETWKPGSMEKKQRSISHFFTSSSPAKPSNTDVNPTSSTPKRARTGSVSNAVVNGSLRKESSRGDEGDEENDDPVAVADHERHAKRSRTSKSPRSASINGRTSLKDRDTQTLHSSGRTSKFLFNGSSSPVNGITNGGQEGEDAEDAEVTKTKERLHRQFLKKLGKPDSMAELRKKNRFLSRDNDEQGGEGSENAEQSDDADGVDNTATSRGKKSGTAAKKSGSKLTPMEKQFLDIKRCHLDTVLAVEVGYKFKFFGEDARVAAKELSIVCIPGKFRYDEHFSEAHIDRFASASIPVHRLQVHVKRLVAAGYKVGVVRQLETAALKAAGDNRNAPFVRKLTNLYTKGTYIDDIEGLEQPSANAALQTGYLLALTESNAKGWGTDEKVQVGMFAVQPTTGDGIFDTVEDGFMRSEIETRMLHISPCELVIIGQLSNATEKLVKHFSGRSQSTRGEAIRITRVEKEKTTAAQSFNHVSDFYASLLKSAQERGQEGKEAASFDRILKLPEHVTVCLSSMINHLTEYGLEHVFDLTKYFQSFSARSHMLLNGNTLNSLEIFQNQTDYRETGSLFWALDRTKTKFGKRLLRRWVGRPLRDGAQLRARVGAVEELKNGESSAVLSKVKTLLDKMKGDLEKSLIRIYYGKCTRPELLGFLQTMQRAAIGLEIVPTPNDVGFESSIVNHAIASLPSVLEDVNEFLGKINARAAQDDDKYTFFRESEETEAMTEHKLGIASVEHELDAHRSIAAERIRKKRVDYVTVAGIEYLIEIDNSQLKHVPASWMKISGTKKISRFHTPEVVRLIRERDQHKESLAAACDKAFADFLTDISTNYQALRDCIQSLATLDCLLSLASVANQPGYVKPDYTDDISIEIGQGRHPMAEQFLLDSYVPNDTRLSSDNTRAMLITGPNMGGKSNYVRQVALLAIMAQIGSYVPAASARFGMLDAVFTRMGAFDNMLAGESTFMVELSETSDILKQATPRSLVILDELGRGTSTHDGVAIAHAVLDHMVRESKCLTLFITHYQALSSLARCFEHDVLKNVHMRFTEESNDGQDITFLYEVGEGVAHRSYGLNVARLAKVPDAVLATAAVKSTEVERNLKRKQLYHLMKSTSRISASENRDELVDQFISALEQL